ncbi:MAG: Xaa-Pro peptidase family protein [Alphaproteobacteria bacterium]
MRVLHFSEAELAGRREAACRAMAARGLDGMLLFKPESHYYLTGYDTFGYCFFQCLYLGADGRLALLTRAPDLRQAQQTSMIEDIRIWVDGIADHPAIGLRDMLRELKAGKRLGIERDTAGLTSAQGRAVDAALAAFALEDADDLVSRLRLVKSAAELAYVREAAKLADAAWAEAVRLTRPGADEAEIVAAMQGAVLAGGGDYPGNAFIVGSGAGALLCRYRSGRRQLDAIDQLTLEYAGVYRQYHACLMHTLLVGEASDEQRRMHAACLEALEACEAALKPGEPLADVFHAHARVMDERGYNAARLNACGYSLGTVYPPCWMDWPMFHAGNAEVAAPDQVFFLHMILMHSETGLAMCLGHTVRVTDDGVERLNRAGLELVVNG